MTSTDTTQSASSQFSSFRVVTTLILCAAVVTGVFWLVRSRHLKQAEASSQWASNALLKMAADPTQNRLDSRFKDADGDLVADPPADPAERIDPQVLTFSYLAGRDTGLPEDRWQAFMDALREAAGREVEYRTYENTEDQLRALADRELHITAFNTGAVAAAVNRCGFVPVGTLAKADGSYGYTCQIIVPADSDLQRPEDLRGHQLTFTNTLSNSGFKAPLLLLVKEFGLRPDRDYAYGFSTSHAESIRGVAEGRLQAASVASDVIELIANQEEFDTSQIRVIYESGRFPPACFGFSYALKDDLAEAVRGVLAGYQFEGTPLEQEFAASSVTQLAPVNFKDAWATVRLIDEFVGHVHDVP